MKWRRLPTLTSSVVAFFAVAIFATAGSLTPPGGPISSTMNSLEDIYASIVGTFDSTGVVADQNGSLIEHLKYIEANMGSGGVGSDSLDFDEFVDAMTLDADTSIANDGFSITFQRASVSEAFDVAGRLSLGSPGDEASLSYEGFEDALQVDINDTQVLRIDNLNLNVSLGANAFVSNVIGTESVAIGGNALSSNVNGYDNVANGYNTLLSNVDGFQNVGIGSAALFSNVSGSNNTALGTGAGINALGSGNVFLGFNAGFNETGADTLWIDNAANASSSALVYGEFDNDYLRFNGDVEIAATASVAGDTRLVGRVAIGNEAFFGDLFGGFPGQTLVSLHEEFTDLATFGISAGTAHTYDLNPTGTATDVFFGEDVFVRTDGTNTEDFTNGIVAGRYYPIHLGSGTVSQMDGLQIQPQTDNGTVTQMRGLLVSNSTTGTGDVGTAYAVYVGTPLGVGGISNNYGLYVADQSGAALSDFNVYSAGAGSLNVFEGNVGIASTSPGETLSVQGTTRLDGHTAAGNIGGIDQSYFVNGPFGSTNSSVLALNETITAPTGDFYAHGISSDLVVDMAVDDAVTSFTAAGNYTTVPVGNTADFYEIVGARNFAYHYGDGAASSIVGAYNLGTHWGDGAVSFLYGSYNNGCNCVEGGTVTDGYGVYSAFHDSSAGGSTTNAYDFYADVQNGGGTITNNYGLYVANQNGGGVVNGYNIYSAGAGTRNIFEGSASVSQNFELSGFVSSNLTPRTTDTFDLGTAALRWRDLYLASGSLHIGVSGDEAVIDYNVNDDYLAFKPDGVNARVVFTDSGLVGISDSAPEFDPINPAVLGLARTFDDTLNQATGLGVGITIDEGTLSPGFSRADAVVGEIYTPDTSTSNFSGQLHGGHFLAEHDGSGIADYVQGSEHYVINGGPGTITSADAGFFQIKNNGTGDITNATGVVVLPAENIGGGTITDNYGLYLHDQSGIGTNNFNLYSIGAGLDGVNYFGGAVGIGTLVPVAKADIYSGEDEALRLSVDNGDPYAFMINNLTFGSTDATGFGLWQDNDGTGNISVGGADRIIIQTDGRIVANEFLGFINNPADNRSGIRGSANITGDADAGSQDITAAGGNVSFQATSGTTDRGISGSFTTVTSGAGGTILTNAIGINGGVQGLGATAIVNAYGGLFGTLASATTAITNSYGISIDSAQLSESGTIDNNYGLYINDQAGIGDSLNYNIFSAGTGINYFEGPIVAPGLSATSVGDAYVCRDPVTGEITFGATCTPSSIKFKKNVENLEHGLDWVSQLRPVTFDWKHNGEPSLGFIAEEVNEVTPLLALYQDGEVYSVNYQIMTSVLAKAIQELDGKVENLSVNGTIDFDSEGWFQGLFARVVTAFKDMLGIEFESGGRIRANELCLDDVCVTKDQLRDLLEGSNIDTPSDDATPTPTPDLEGDSEQGPTDQPTPSDTPAPQSEPGDDAGTPGGQDDSSGGAADGGESVPPSDPGTPENGQ